MLKRLAVGVNEKRPCARVPLETHKQPAFGMSDEEGYDPTFDGAELAEHDTEPLPAGLRIVFDDEAPDESRSTVEVGCIPSACVVQNHKLKKREAGFVFPNIPLRAVKITVGFLMNGEMIPETLGEIMEVYTAAKLIGNESLIQGCVDKVWTLRSEWMTDEVEDRETECAWMYLVMSEFE